MINDGQKLWKTAAKLLWFPHAEHGDGIGSDRLMAARKLLSKPAVANHLKSFAVQRNPWDRAMAARIQDINELILKVEECAPAVAMLIRSMGADHLRFLYKLGAEHATQATQRFPGAYGDAWHSLRQARLGLDGLPEGAVDHQTALTVAERLTDVPVRFLLKLHERELSDSLFVSQLANDALQENKVAHALVRRSPHVVTVLHQLHQNYLMRATLEVSQGGGLGSAEAAGL